MYKPQFNSVLVKIDDATAKWGTGNDDSMLGQSYREGEVISFGTCHATDQHPEFNPTGHLDDMLGKQIMWNEGVEAGTVHEVDGAQYAFIYWWDIRGVKA